MEANMKQCQCQRHDILTGPAAEEYSRKEYMKEVQWADGGWRYLFKCQICGSYWEKTWEGGGGFDFGMTTLRRLFPAELKERWPQVET
jgi:hypothetical protein